MDHRAARIKRLRYYCTLISSFPFDSDLRLLPLTSSSYCTTLRTICSNSLCSLKEVCTFTRDDWFFETADAFMLSWTCFCGVFVPQSIYAVAYLESWLFPQKLSYQLVFSENFLAATFQESWSSTVKLPAFQITDSSRDARYHGRISLLIFGMPIINSYASCSPIYTQSKFEDNQFTKAVVRKLKRKHFGGKLSRWLKVLFRYDYYRADYYRAGTALVTQCAEMQKARSLVIKIVGD